MYNATRRKYQSMYADWQELRSVGLQIIEAQDEVAKKYFVSRSTVNNAIMAMRAEEERMAAQETLEDELMLAQ